MYVMFQSVRLAGICQKNEQFAPSMQASGSTSERIFRNWAIFFDSPWVCKLASRVVVICIIRRWLVRGCKYNWMSILQSQDCVHIHFQNEPWVSCSITMEYREWNYIQSEHNVYLPDLNICSGTEKQHVADDYAKRLHMGQVECTDLMGQAISKLSARSSSSLNFQYCEYLNISVCNATQNGSVSVVGSIASKVMSIIANRCL